LSENVSFVIISQASTLNGEALPVPLALIGITLVNIRFIYRKISDSIAEGMLSLQI